MTKYITLDGNKYVVSPQFAAAVDRVLGTMTFDMGLVEAQRLGLLTRSNTRGFTERTVRLLSRDDDGERIERDVVVRDPIAGLSSEDQQRLTYLTHVKNVANAIRVVGAHHDPVKEWGLDGWDAVHGNKHVVECGCTRHYVFDHHSAVDHFGHGRVSKERKHHEIAHYPCKAHVQG